MQNFSPVNFSVPVFAICHPVYIHVLTPEFTYINVMCDTSVWANYSRHLIYTSNLSIQIYTSNLSTQSNLGKTLARHNYVKNLFT